MIFYLFALFSVFNAYAVPSTPTEIIKYTSSVVLSRMKVLEKTQIFLNSDASFEEKVQAIRDYTGGKIKKLDEKKIHEVILSINSSVVGQMKSYLELIQFSDPEYMPEDRKWLLPLSQINYEGLSSGSIGSDEYERGRLQVLYFSVWTLLEGYKRLQDPIGKLDGRKVQYFKFDYLSALEIPVLEDILDTIRLVLPEWWPDFSSSFSLILHTRSLKPDVKLKVKDYERVKIKLISLISRVKSFGGSDRFVDQIEGALGQIERMDRDLENKIADMERRVQKISEDLAERFYKKISFYKFLQIELSIRSYPILFKMSQDLEGRMKRLEQKDRLVHRECREEDAVRTEIAASSVVAVEATIVAVDADKVSIDTAAVAEAEAASSVVAVEATIAAVDADKVSVDMEAVAEADLAEEAGCDTDWQEELRKQLETFSTKKREVSQRARVDAVVVRPEAAASSGGSDEARVFAHGQRRKMLERVFDPKGRVSFDEMERFIEALGGHLAFKRRGSSHCKIIFPGLIHGGFRPHGTGHSPQLTGFSLRLFREAIEEAGFTP